MTDVPPNEPLQTDRRARKIARAGLPGLLISLAAGGWCWSATGPGLGLFLGLLLLATLFAPALALAECGRYRWLVVAAIASGAGCVWLLGLTKADVSLFEWSRCVMVLAAYAWALAGVATLLTLARIPSLLAAALTVFIGLLWLTWPIWMIPWLTQTESDWLVPGNPVFAVNSVLKHLGSWDHAPIAYRALTVLNQDIPYRFPTSILPAGLLHAVLGAPGMLLTLRRTRSRSVGV